MAEIQYLLNPTHITTPGAHTAEVITNVPSGSISAVTVQNALNEIGNRNYAGSSSFSGAANSAVKLETARTLTIGATGKAFDGSTNQSWSLAEIGAQANITAGTTSQYYRGDKTFQDFATSVRAAILTGLDTSKLSSREVLSTDSLLSAIGLLQGQLTSIIEQSYYAQAGDTKLEIPLSYTGTGAGVLTLRLQSDITQTISIDGAGKFYSDSAGTTGESTTSVLTANVGRSIYIKVASGTCNITIPYGYALRYFGPSSLGYYAITEAINAPKINGLDCKYFGFTSCDLRFYSNLSYSIITGTTRPWLFCSIIYFSGDSLTVSGTTYAWANATQVVFSGNSLTVSGTTYAWANAASVQFYGNSLTVSAPLSTTCLYTGTAGLDVYLSGTSVSVTYATTRTWPANISRIYLRPSVGSMPSADVDRLFIDLDATPGLTAVGSKVLDFRGNCGAVTAASATARANLATKGFAVSFNV